jgi:hypothetical protein
LAQGALIKYRFLVAASYVPKGPLAGSPTLGRLGGLGPGEADRGQKALWLAGDGYRAALFHLGALTRLNELGLLAQLGTIGAVSGGAIAAAVLAARIPWPLADPCGDWTGRMAEPLRAIAARNAQARSLLRRPFPGGAAGAAFEERYARELIDSLGGEPQRGPRFVFGASGLTLSGLAAGWEECVEWQLDDSVTAPPGYSPELVADTIATVRTDLRAFGPAEQAVVENHGYLLADAAVRAGGFDVTAVTGTPAEAPHPDWTSEARVREALGSSSRRWSAARLRDPRGRWPGARRP